MKLKSYFAGTVGAAMALAREELGPEALLVQSKKTLLEARKLGRYEVVFALQDPVQEPEEAPSFAEVLISEREPAMQVLSSELEQLRHRIEDMSGRLKTPVTRQVPQPHSKLAMALAAADLDIPLAEELAREAHGDLQVVRKIIEGRVRVDSTLGVPTASRKIVALVGPPGAGKTTALVKLAISYGLPARHSMHLISTDVYRIGGAEQLMLYASVIGAGCQTVKTPLALEQALEDHGRTELIFIDTPAWTPRMGELAAYIASHPEIDVHLVLPVSSRACDLPRIVERYAPFRPAKLLFTRIDETGRYGSLLNESHRTGKPLSFLSTGQDIPEDLEAATTARVADLVLGLNALSIEERN